MPVLYGEFQMPEAIETEEQTATFARFRAGPFERGFGHTIGNALRRMMLTSLEAPAIIGVRIEGVSHEYMAIDGIIQDMVNIVLNVKGALLRKLAVEGEGLAPRGQKLITTTIEVTEADIKEKGQVVVTLGDIVTGSDFVVVNPELQLFVITKPMKKQVDLRVAFGRGYVSTERQAVIDRLIDEVQIDALFSPVRLVNYTVTDTRVGRDTDFDALIMEVTTDGRISPQEALSFAAQIGLSHFTPFQKVEKHEIAFQRDEALADTDRDEILGRLGQKIDEIELSVRSTNCLNGAGIEYIGELAVMKETEMLQFRNFGKKSLGEIRDKLLELGLGFDQEDLLRDKYGITRENLKQLIEAFLVEKAIEGEMTTGNGE
jgi:DNA-directed RNA polymerase subunit alpha